MIVARRVLLSLAALLSGPASLLAHDPGFSSSHLRWQRNALHVELRLNDSDAAALVPEADTDGNGRLDAGEVAAGASALTRLAESVELVIAGRPLTAIVRDIASAEDDDVAIELEFGDAGPGALVWTVDWLQHTPRGHFHYAAVHGQTATPLHQALLRADTRTLTAELAPNAAPSTGAVFGEFLGLGVEHILIGYDHLLFLLALLLTARGWRGAAVAITAFTIAHSVTLAAASLDVLRLPGPLVESTIAASIVWVCIQNLRGNADRRHRFATTFAFGLVHGFGFASVLAELGVAQTGGGVALPLLSFNLGVELGQLAVAALVLPVLWLARRFQPGAYRRRIAPGLSLFGIAAGGWWLVERTLLG